MARLHAIHLVIGGDYQLVQRVAVDAKSRGADADADPREAIPADCQRELGHSTLDAPA